MQVVKESFGDGSEREGEEVKERDTHSALAERFLHAISTYPADEQEKLITHFIRLIFVDMTRYGKPHEMGAFTHFCAVSLLLAIFLFPGLSVE